MSKILLFVCLALFGASVYGQTQIRFLNAKYDSATTFAFAANLEDYFNTTVGVALRGNTDISQGGFSEISKTEYLAVPQYSFQVGQLLTFYVVDQINIGTGTFIVSANYTLQEGQSYSFVFLDTTAAEYYVQLNGPLLLGFDERPSAPVPYGKALVRIVNVAVSTFPEEVANMTVYLNGTGVEGQVAVIPFAQASEFLVYDTAIELTLSVTLPVFDGFLTRTKSFNTTIDKTTVIYIRGDVGEVSQQGILVTDVDFPPAPPSAGTPAAAPMTTAPMTDAPAAGPVASGPQAPVAAPVRAPVKRVSSAAQTVAQIAGVAGLVSLLF